MNLVAGSTQKVLPSIFDSPYEILAF